MVTVVGEHTCTSFGLYNSRIPTKLDKLSASKVQHSPGTRLPQSEPGASAEQSRLARRALLPASLG
eukprot:1183343-Prorocentrum_minimum.AAC.1